MTSDCSTWAAFAVCEAVTKSLIALTGSVTPAEIK